MSEDIENYRVRKQDLKNEGIDPEQYGALASRRKELENRLAEINKLEKSDSMQGDLDECVGKMLVHRRLLTEKRRGFLRDVLSGNPHVQMEVQSMSAPREYVERETRDLLQCDEKFARDIEELVKILTEEGDIAEKVSRLKEEVQHLRNGKTSPQDKRFADHLRKLSPEQLDRLQCWFPEDALEVTFDKAHKNLNEGSPGQKNAALLAFLLSYGENPLLLDQPEDDLDNELIYELIVQQLREVKSRRQIIIVTHDANIVVNGDAEMVVALEPRNGETYKGCHNSLQDKEVRTKVCNLMEGGKRAFDQRYRKIHL